MYLFSVFIIYVLSLQYKRHFHMSGIVKSVERNILFATPVAVGEEEILLSFLAELTDPQYVCGNHNSSRKFPWMLRKGASLLPFSMGSAGPPFFWKEEEEIPSHNSNITHLNHSWKQTVNVNGKRCRSCKCKLIGHGNKMGKRTWYFEPSPAGF